MKPESTHIHTDESSIVQESHSHKMVLVDEWKSQNQPKLYDSNSCCDAESMSGPTAPFSKCQKSFCMALSSTLCVFQPLSRRHCLSTCEGKQYLVRVLIQEKRQASLPTCSFNASNVWGPSYSCNAGASSSRVAFSRCISAVAGDEEKEKQSQDSVVG